MRAGKAACFAADEFFRARISNPPPDGLRPPGDARPGRKVSGTALPGGAPTKNQALAGLRHFFDVLVGRHAAVLNPFQSVRGVRHPFGEGRTPEVSVAQARQLLASIKTDRGFGLRDRAVLGTLIHTGARVGAISRFRMQDLRDHGNYRALQFAEKGVESREIPVRHDLDEWIAAYFKGAGLTDAAQGVVVVSRGSAARQPAHRTGHFATGRTVDAQTPAQGRRVAGDPLAPLLPRPGWSRICSPRTCRSKTSSIWPDTPTPAPPRSTTGAGGASPATSSSESPSEILISG